MCQQGGMCAWWLSGKLFTGFLETMKFPCSKRDCLYCRHRMPGHWAGRHNIFLSFITCIVWILAINTLCYILFVLFFLTTDECEIEFAKDLVENGDIDDDGTVSTPSVAGEIFLALFYLLLGGLITYTGFWAYETRNVFWQLVWLVIALVCIGYYFKIMIDSFSYAGICNGLFAINGVLDMGMIVAIGHTIVFGFLTYQRRLEAPEATHGLGAPGPAATAAAHGAGQPALAAAAPQHAPGAPIAPAVPIHAAGQQMPPQKPLGPASVPVAMVTRAATEDYRP